jgi:hypothetical protein
MLAFEVVGRLSLPVQEQWCALGFGIGHQMSINKNLLDFASNLFCNIS